MRAPRKRRAIALERTLAHDRPAGSGARHRLRHRRFGIPRQARARRAARRRLASARAVRRMPSARARRCPASTTSKATSAAASRRQLLAGVDPSSRTCAAETAGNQQAHERNTVVATRNLLDAMEAAGVQASSSTSAAWPCSSPARACCAKTHRSIAATCRAVRMSGRRPKPRSIAIERAAARRPRRAHHPPRAAGRLQRLHAARAASAATSRACSSPWAAAATRSACATCAPPRA